MPRDPLIGLIMATRLEAEPFIGRLGLEKLSERPFVLYGKADLRLILSGIGKANAAMACAFFIQQAGPSLICNLGAAGATQVLYRLGEGLAIARIIEPDRPDLANGLPHEHTPQILAGFAGVTLATQDRPIRDAGERQSLASMASLVDMEGAAVIQACRHFGTRGYLFKFVSDTPSHATSHDIRTNIALYRDEFFRFFLKEVLPRLREALHGGAQMA